MAHSPPDRHAAGSSWPIWDRPTGYNTPISDVGPDPAVPEPIPFRVQGGRAIHTEWPTKLRQDTGLSGLKIVNVRDLLLNGRLPFCCLSVAVRRCFAG